MTNLAVREPVLREPQNLTVLSNEQLKFISSTDFVPRGLRGNLPAILACVATGRALGIDDMTAIRNIHIIDGRPAFAAELMVMLVRRKHHSITGKVTAEGATVTGTRADNGDTMSVEFTIEMAKRAGLAGKTNWKQYPESMCWARAVSQLCRMLFPDCFAGGTYTAEELGDEHTDSAGEPQAATGDVPDPVSQAAYTEREPASPAEEWDGKFPPPDDAEIPEVKLVTRDQIKRMFTIAGRAKVTTDRVHEIMVEQAGVEHSAEIPAAIYDHLITLIQAEATDLTFAERAAEAQANRDALGGQTNA